MEDLKRQVTDAMEAIGIVDLAEECQKLQKQTLEPDFWSDNLNAQAVTKKVADLQKRLDVWQSLEKACDDTLELVALGDKTMVDELQSQYDKLRQQFDKLAHELAYSGPYDKNSAILEIFAGAGGTDAQDWAEMLMRMYIRWAETHGAKVTIISKSDGDEAGIKSVTLEIDGHLMYGKLQGEHGVHRLVRLSPFNSDNLRQTSFAKVVVMPEIDTPEEAEELVADEQDKADVVKDEEKK